MSILIVDDQPDNVRLLEMMLTKAGYDPPLSAASATGAFEIMEKAKQDAGLQIDLILMDVMMPEISGIDACKKIKSDEAWKDVPILMVTARTDMECLEEAFVAGAMDYIVKPVRRIELLARVRSALKLKQETDARKKKERDLIAEKENLEKAMNEIRVLQGFLPICAYCKKIRDVTGLWHQMEAYIMSRTEVKFTHGICETCLKGNYPQFADKIAEKIANSKKAAG